MLVLPQAVRQRARRQTKAGSARRVASRRPLPDGADCGMIPNPDLTAFHNESNFMQVMKPSLPLDSGEVVWEKPSLARVE